MYEIEKNVPLQGTKRGAPPKYPFGEMEVGDSFFVPGKTPKSIGASMANWARRYGVRFAARSVDGGVRVWRVE